MAYHVELTADALDDIEDHRRAGRKKVLNKLYTLLAELEVHPRSGTGRPEQLRYDFAGAYSRRITRQHRLIYEIHDDVVTVLVIAALGNYDDR